MYTPTPVELTELGFSKHRTYWLRSNPEQSCVILYFDEPRWEARNVTFFPKNREDILKMIELISYPE